MVRRVILPFIALLGLVSCNTQPADDASLRDYGNVSRDYTQYVDPFIGTGGHGHTYPGATLPFGMVQLSPDTRLTGWDGCSAYHASDSVIYGFSHTHLSGTGCSDYGDVLLLPVVGEVPWVSGYEMPDEKGYGSAFDKAAETAAPGYYAVHLNDYDVDVELTATRRVGMHRYHFPAGQQAGVLIDLEHRDELLGATLRVVDDSTVVGMRRSRVWARDQQLYFAARFSEPVTEMKYGSGKKGLFGNQGSVDSLKLLLNFDGDTERNILVKVAISAVDIEGALKNMEEELPGWDFDGVRRTAQKAWNSELARIDVEGGTDEQMTIFYSALYHSFLSPDLFMDVDGRYRGTDLKVHKAIGFENYTVFSLWDTYRATHPLFTLVQQKRTTDFINTFIQQYNHGGWLPVWELAGNYTGCMIGYHAVPVIADAYVKGIGGFDADKAFEAMKHSANADKLGLEFYKKMGYIPSDKEHESVSKTLEYAYDDWCIAAMAEKMGNGDDYHQFISRAQFYKNLYNPESGFMQARYNGGWQAGFDPAEVNYNFTEANSWQYSFYVPQDMTGLAALHGGKKMLADQLDALFSVSSETAGRKQADITGLVGQYAHGNEPSHHMAYLYSFVNQPWKTQKMVRRLMDEMYTIHPDGLIGNEDCGQMSSWLVMSAMGFYSVTPGTDTYVVGTPWFEKMTLRLENGRDFVITAPKVSRENCYIASAQLNGVAYNKGYLVHHDIMQGGELSFTMTDTPSQWAVADDEVPVTAIHDNVLIPSPYLLTGERTFHGTTTIALACADKETKIFYTLDGSAPDETSRLYTKPFVANDSFTLRFKAFKNGARSFEVTSEFIRLNSNRTIRLYTPYVNQYAAGGEGALVDNMRGANDFRLGAWQGYQGVNIEAVVDLGEVTPIKHITMGFFQDINAWVFMPDRVDYYTSIDGGEYVLAGTVDNVVAKDDWDIQKHDFVLSKNMGEARFVKVVARNQGVCPPEHKAAGEPSWLFSDEIVIE